MKYLLWTSTEAGTATSVSWRGVHTVAKCMETDRRTLHQTHVLFYANIYCRWSRKTQTPHWTTTQCSTVVRCNILHMNTLGLLYLLYLILLSICWNICIPIMWCQCTW